MAVPTLITNKICPFAHRAWLTLEESGLPYELKETGLGTATTGPKPQWFTDVYRSALGADLTSDGKVPVLQDGDFTLTESAVVADYLASKFAGTPAGALLPATPRERAEVALFGEQVAGRFVGAFYPALKSASLDEETRAKAKDSFLAAVRAFSAALEWHGGPYVLGSRCSLADVNVWPFVARMPILAHYCGISVPDTPEYAAFHAWRAAMEARPSVQATAMPDQYFIDGYRAYAHPAAA